VDNSEGVTGPNGRESDGPSRTRALLLGSGEVGCESVIALQRLGAEVIAADRYADAPLHGVADRSVVVNMTDADELAATISWLQPKFVGDRNRLRRRRRVDRSRRYQFANAAGLSVVAVIKEVASGVNDTRPKLTALLKEDSWGTLVVEYKDRLSRVGFGWFDVLLGVQGRRIVVAEAATEEKADLLDDFVSIIYSFAARLYGLRSARRRPMT
jgi:hypothetical protein